MKTLLFKIYINLRHSKIVRYIFKKERRCIYCRDYSEPYPGLIVCKRSSKEISWKYAIICKNYKEE